MVQKGVRKATTSVYVDQEMLQRLKDMGLDLTSVTSKAMEIIDSDEFADLAVEMRLKINEDVILKTKEEILQLETRLGYMRQRLENAIIRKQEIIDEYENVKRTVMLSRYMYQLNSAIIGAQYDIPTIETTLPDLIVKIKDINPLFDLKVHVESFRKVMNR